MTRERGSSIPASTMSSGYQQTVANIDIAIPRTIARGQQSLESSHQPFGIGPTRKRERHRFIPREVESPLRRVQHLDTSARFGEGQEMELKGEVRHRSAHARKHFCLEPLNVNLH